MKILKLKENIENFDIFIRSLYSYKTKKGNKQIQENEEMVASFKEGLKSLGSRAHIIAEVTFVVAGKEEKQTYLLQELAKDGLQLPEDVESFQITIKGKFLSKVENVKMSSGYEQLFITDKFIIKQNSTKEIKEEIGNVIIQNMELYQEMTNNRIRFGEEKIAEV